MRKDYLARKILGEIARRRRSSWRRYLIDGKLIPELSEFFRKDHLTCKRIYMCAKTVYILNEDRNCPINVNLNFSTPVYIGIL